MDMTFTQDEYDLLVDVLQEVLLMDENMGLNDKDRVTMNRMVDGLTNSIATKPNA